MTDAASSVGLPKYPSMPLPIPNDDALSGQWAGVMLELDRPALMTKFVMALHDASIRNPKLWRRVSAIGARTGTNGAEVDQIVAAACFVDQRADDPCLIMLTNRGWDVASSYRF